MLPNTTKLKHSEEGQISTEQHLIRIVSIGKGVFWGESHHQLSEPTQKLIS